MGRRRRSDRNLFELLYPIAAFGLFLIYFVPGARQAIHGLASVSLILAVLATLATVVFLTYRSIQNRRRRSLEADQVRAFNLNKLPPTPPTSRAKNPPGSPEPLSDDSRYMPPPHRPAPEPTPALKPAPITNTAILSRLRAIDWYQFEKIVAITFHKLGYQVTAKGGANPDGGIDLLITKDGVTTAVQCKHWRTWDVGVKTIREFLGALTDAGMQKGIFVTLQGYTTDAKALADKHGIEILTETRLAEMLEATNARFDPDTLELLDDKRKYCPKCGREMVVKTASKGKNVGKDFWACPGFPKNCNYILRS